MMEYHGTTDGIRYARNIFDRGMDAFKGDVEYVIRHLNFLISINDENSASHFTILGS